LRNELDLAASLSLRGDRFFFTRLSPGRIFTTMKPARFWRWPAGVAGLLAICVAAAGQTTAPAAGRAASAPARAGANAIRVNPHTGHVSNYDEAKVGTYTLPDPLVLANGQPVRYAETWFNLRRPELLKIYQSEIYGAVPANAPAVTWSVASTDPAALNGTAIGKHLTGQIGAAGGPRMNVTIYTPAHAAGPVPLILCINFPGATGDPIADILARGWGYATITYTDIQPDAATTYSGGAIHLALAAGETKPAPDQWGTISAWAWGLSRIVDYLQTDAAVDARQIAIMGHSRLGKTVLWAGAQDQRIAAVYSSCGGEMGSSLARRDYGETVDDMATNFPWQFAGNFQKYMGHWNDLPVDTHMMIALNAPHPVFITGGVGDQWSDPRGEFLAEVAAGPVYRLVGRTDLGTKDFPAVNTPIITGDLGFNYHSEGHAATPRDWQAFLTFLSHYVKTPAKP